MKNILLLLLVGPVAIYASEKEEAISFFETYKDKAIQEMQLHHVPASITLAQAYLESDGGKSELAIRANNFFGIKCKQDWHGDTILHSDDKPNECFRVYPTIDSSFRDHSLFLLRPNYKALFTYGTNYKKWAYGLKAAGYATEKSYAKKLIHTIEFYKLYRYDTDSVVYNESGIYEHWPLTHP